MTTLEIRLRPRARYQSPAKWPSNTCTKSPTTMQRRMQPETTFGSMPQTSRNLDRPSTDFVEKVRNLQEVLVHPIWRESDLSCRQRTTSSRLLWSLGNDL